MRAMECGGLMDEMAEIKPLGRGVRPLVLASRSPRRRELLTNAGISHESGQACFEDSVLRPGRVSPAQWVMSLAYLKAWAASREVPAPAVVLGADTACVEAGELIGTPRDATEAGGMIRRLSGRSHEVLTGVALVDVETGRRRMFTERAVVRVGEIPDAEIDAYVDSGAWQGKAGAYNLAERLKAGWPITYEGDPEAVMGLPTRAVRRALVSLTTELETSL